MHKCGQEKSKLSTQVIYYLKNGLWRSSLNTKGDEICQTETENSPSDKHSRYRAAEQAQCFWGVCVVSYLIRQVGHANIKEGQLRLQHVSHQDLQLGLHRPAKRKTKPRQTLETHLRHHVCVCETELYMSTLRVSFTDPDRAKTQSSILCSFSFSFSITEGGREEGEGLAQRPNGRVYLFLLLLPLISPTSHYPF